MWKQRTYDGIKYIFFGIAWVEDAVPREEKVGAFDMRCQVVRLIHILILTLSKEHLLYGSQNTRR